jgi:hypothetical protein
MAGGDEEGGQIVVFDNRLTLLNVEYLNVERERW